ncbi:hypothetical protein A2U01_0084707, partial [Trifolium medium]|nr:hypothetical protein [Trifolium medium]
CAPRPKLCATRRLPLYRQILKFSSPRRAIPACATRHYQRESLSVLNGRRNAPYTPARCAPSRKEIAACQLNGATR